MFERLKSNTDREQPQKSSTDKMASKQEAAERFAEDSANEWCYQIGQADEPEQ